MNQETINAIKKIISAAFAADENVKVTAGTLQALIDIKELIQDDNKLCEIMLQEFPDTNREGIIHALDMAIVTVGKKLRA